MGPPLNVETSYLNFKGIGLLPQALPSGLRETRGYGDFFGNGRADIFAAIPTYWPPTTVSAATPARFELYRRDEDGTYTLDSSRLSGAAGCIHPRKALVADFNGDATADVFVVCHGFDAPPFPGERNKVVLSRPDGTYVVRDASDDVGFFHGGSAADLDGDGDVDVIVTNHPSSAAILLLNDGAGAFTRGAFPLPPALAAQYGYFTAELVDVDGDDYLDLLLGGHEWEGADTVLLPNDGTNDFSRVAAVTLPPMTGEGVVLDFVVTGSGERRDIWVLRTSGGDGTFYLSRTIQRVSLPALTSTTALHQRPADWIPWLIPAVVDGQAVVASDDASSGVSVLQ